MKEKTTPPWWAMINNTSLKEWYRLTSGNVPKFWREAVPVRIDKDYVNCVSMYDLRTTIKLKKWGIAIDQLSWGG